jgi:hypothetical protein
LEKSLNGNEDNLGYIPDEVVSTEVQPVFCLEVYSFTEDGSNISIPETIRHRPKRYGGNEGN